MSHDLSAVARRRLPCAHVVHLGTSHVGQLGTQVLAVLNITHSSISQYILKW